jgi:hypothetical protein
MIKLFSKLLKQANNSEDAAKKQLEKMGVFLTKNGFEGGWKSRWEMWSLPKWYRRGDYEISLEGETIEDPLVNDIDFNAPIEWKATWTVFNRHGGTVEHGDTLSTLALFYHSMLDQGLFNEEEDEDEDDDDSTDF